MLKIKDVINIARSYINIVTKNEGDIFNDFSDFGTGIIFHYQNKEFIGGNKKAMWFGELSPFIVSKKDGTIYHLFKDSISDKGLIKKFIAKEITGISLCEIKKKFPDV